jgi:hypothetical protein
LNLRDFESISIFFSAKEIEEFLTAIDERRSRRLAHDRVDRPGSVEQPVYSSNAGEGVFSEVRPRERRSPTIPPS